MGAILGTGIMAAPERTSVPAGFHAYQAGPRERLPGARHRVRGWRGRRTRLVSAPEGLSLVGTVDHEPITVRYDDVAALVYRGADRVTLVGANGEAIFVNMRVFADAARLREQLDANVPSDLVVRIDDPLPLSALVMGKLESTVFVNVELAALPDCLREDEIVLNLGRAQRGNEHGLAVMTNQRLLYLSTGYTGVRKTIATQIEIELDQVTRVGRLWPGISAHSLDVRADGVKLRIGTLTPKGRAAEFSEALQVAIDHRSP